MSKKILKNLAITLIEDNLRKFFNIGFAGANEQQIFKALAAVAMDELFEIRKNDKKPVPVPKAKSVTTAKTKTKLPIKTLHYLSIEFLPGRTLKNTLFNLGWDKILATALKTRGIDINKIYAVEQDAGIGNGGLGRLAACFMDSLATLGYAGTCHCIKYDYGLFNQRIIDGQQVETPDEWLSSSGVWLNARPDETVTVRFNGYVKQYLGADGKIKFRYEDCQEVEAFPYDMMLSGYDAKVVSNLKLWQAMSKRGRDIKASSHAEFACYVNEAKEIESITSVLYPNSDHAYGKTLRLKQQYFLVSASMQNIVKSHVRRGLDLRDLPKCAAVHINDTHPSMCIPELMRILMDDYGFGWDEAWDIVQKCVSYTNHTVMSEALEVWEEDLLARRVPRVYEIICEINRRFCDFLRSKKVANNVIDQMSIIHNHRVHMANLAVVASHTVNGVSKIHSEILRDRVFKNFAAIYPNRFINITNGITHRRWLSENNSRLNEYIVKAVGDEYYKDPTAFQNLASLLGDSAALRKLNAIKLANKRDFADWLFEKQGVRIDPESRFDVHVKRIHEYKRQLLNVLRIIHIYNTLRENPNAEVTPQTFIFAGKAASSYHMAKRIIKLINQLAADIAADENISKILKVVFVENFSVTISEKLMPATEVSQQISLAGQEASGTGNMKAVMNGGLMLCTWDGANAEISHQCGKESSFMFGMTPQEVDKVWREGYNPIDTYNQSPAIIGVIDALNKGFNGESFRDIASYLLNTAGYDHYMCLADFEDYIQAHNKMDSLYRKPLEWAKVSLRNIANMGFFSSDRAIKEYAEKVWGLTRLK
jgi:starch phosphorylase